MVTRWFDVLAYAVCAFTVWMAVGRWVTLTLRPAASLLGDFSPLVIAVVVIGFAFCSWNLVGRSRTHAWLGLRHLIAHPPAWVAAAFVIALMQTVAAKFTAQPSSPGLEDDLRWFWNELPRWLRYAVVAMLGTLTVWPFARDTYHWAARRWLHRRGDVVPAAAERETFDAIVTWVGDDSEISSPGADRFEHARIANRIAERLRSGDEAPTLAVIGPLGSGKSSVRRLTQHALRHDRRIRVVPVSLWPFDSPESAVRGVLRALVQELGRHVGSAPLVGLSDDYVLAIEKSAGAYGGVARLLRGSSDPETIVKKIAEIACAIGIRLVLWVEDLERFSGGDHLDATQQAAREVERLGPVRALLYLLDRCPAVSVVVADTSLRTRFDIGKIARFVERMPTMDESHTWRVIQAVRSACLNGYPKRFIDPAAPKHREQLGKPLGSHPILSWLNEFDSDPSPRAAISLALSTPRALKSALRITIEAWEVLRGEIDFDSLLAASVVRVTRPDVFEVLDEHVEAFRHGLRRSRDRSDHAPHPAIPRIDDLLGSAPPRNAAAIRSLVSFVFPKYPPNGDTDDREYMQNPQGLNVTKHTDNWRRYLNQEQVLESESDQAALESIEQWRAGQGGTLVARVADAARSDQIETFVSQFKARELLRLASDVADLLATQSAQDWEHRSSASGITAVWRMIHRRRAGEDDVFQAIHAIVERVGPHHLPLAHDIVHYFATPGERVTPLMSEEQQQKVRESLQTVLVKEFASDGAAARLKVAMRDGSPWTIYWIAWGLHRVRSGDKSGKPFDDWDGLSATLVTLAEQDPDTGVPLCVPFITNSGMQCSHGINDEGEWESAHEWKGEVDAAAAARLFDVDRLRAAIFRFQIPEDAEPQVKAHLEAAVRWARESFSPDT